MAISARQLIGIANNSYIPPGGDEGQVLAKNSNIDFDVDWQLGGGAGVTAYSTISELPLTNNDAGKLAFVSENNRLYIWNGTGWFNIALINTNPTITQGPDPSYFFATDGTPIVITLLASDPEGIPITWSFQVTSGTLGDTAVITQDDNVFTITPSTDSEDIGTFSITFTASDGVNIATAVSSFTLNFVTADQFYNQSVVLTTSSVNNGNNNVFVDSSATGVTITRDGTTTQGTFSPYSPAGWSGYFDGTGDELTIANNAAFNFGSDNFTVECWFNLTADAALDGSSTRPACLVGPGQLTTNEAWVLSLGGNSTTSGTSLFFQARNTSGTPTILTYTFTFNKNTWYHVSATQSGNNLKLFVNGNVVAENTSWTTDVNSGGSLIRIGRRAVSASFEHYFPGYISNVRVVKGTALYTTNFTPSTIPLTAVAGTSLLTLQDNRFIDRSTNNFAITRVGDTIPTPFSPFLPTEIYNTFIHGGSAFFTGSGLLTASNSALSIGTEDFTMEAWIYPTSTSTWQQVIGPQYGPDNVAILLNQGVNLFAYAGGGLLNWGGVVRLFQWNHVVLTRQSGTLRLYHNGVQFATTATFANSMSGTIYSIGRRVAGGELFFGYISGARVVKGTALYTADFTPSNTAPAPVTGTNLLLNFTNANIFDETGKIVVETVGDAKVSTDVVKYGNSSMAFDGTGDYLLIPNSPKIDLGTGNFTIEMWLNLANVASDWQTIISRAYTVAGGWRLYKTTSANELRWYVGSSLVVTTTQGHLSNNTWAHVAVVRNNGVATVYINGVSRGSASNATNLTPGNYAIEIGGGVQGGSYPMTGHISDLRITNGRARYIANFTPPTAQLGFTNAE